MQCCFLGSSVKDVGPIGHQGHERQGSGRFDTASSMVMLLNGVNVRVWHDLKWSHLCLSDVASEAVVG